MVLDTSAIVALVLKEPRYKRLALLIDQAKEVLVGAPTMVEASMILSSRMRQDARPILEVLRRQVRASVTPFDNEHIWAATGAFLRFGRGRHAASLNFGDCMSYAVASVAGQPLLYIGEDFNKSDIPAV